MDEDEALVHSVGMHAVFALKEENLRQLTATYDGSTRECAISVCLRNETEECYLEAVGHLADLQILFQSEVHLTYSFDEYVHEHTAKASERQFSFV
ncbi:hypothetical protein SAMN05660916_00579 [Arthrobacter sp. 31Cvi3.1E]|uniref:hypothetical protein n=1 Tax=Paenarthrobacter nicotinovorans TaxID=29320 RepID=UPI0009A8C4FB|nr:hypothetical protein SAMN05660916_00579 [Arthrobacter sp. 31Cvi3.1E]